MSSDRTAEPAVIYREQAPPPALAPWVRCVWELTVQGEGGPGWVVPDGVLDLVASGPELHVAGPDTRPWPVRRQPGAVAVGVRFHPGAAPALLGPPASALRDLRVGPGDLWGRAGRELAERVGEAASPAVGLGERQLRRRFLDGVGYGPKTLARVLRFQRLLALLTDDRAGRPTLAEAAALAGYADQAHMTAECTRLAGRSPAAVRAGR